MIGHDLAALADNRTHVDIEQAKTDRAAYARHMLAGNTDAACEIEQRYSLYGYTPELVSIGLSAAAEGRDVDEAIEDYIDGLGLMMRGAR